MKTLLTRRNIGMNFHLQPFKFCVICNIRLYFVHYFIYSMISYYVKKNCYKLGFCKNYTLDNLEGHWV